jgi:hypothetical protein
MNAEVVGVAIYDHDDRRGIRNLISAALTTDLGQSQSPTDNPTTAAVTPATIKERFIPDIMSAS